MSDVKPAWSGELRYAFQDTDRIVFYVHPDDQPQNLIQGRRYACVFVEIADDETANIPERTARNERQRMPSNIAAILCKREDFQRYAAEKRLSAGKGATIDATEENAIRYVYEVCDISSRAELDLKQEALEAFQDLIELPFYREQKLGEF